jgi:hypothetical protein
MDVGPKAVRNFQSSDTSVSPPPDSEVHLWLQNKAHLRVSSIQIVTAVKIGRNLVNPRGYSRDSESALVFYRDLSFVLWINPYPPHAFRRQLNETYQRLSSQTRGYATLNRAQITVELESYLSLRQVRGEEMGG